MEVKRFLLAALVASFVVSSCRAQLFEDLSDYYGNVSPSSYGYDSPSPAAYYYYAAPSPTPSPYGDYTQPEVPPTYYYYAAPAPTPSPYGGYTQPEVPPTYYYVAPAPTPSPYGGYGDTQPEVPPTYYYYSAPAPTPSPYGSYGYTQPEVPPTYYYYVAPTPAPSPYGGYTQPEVPPTYYYYSAPTPAPSPYGLPTPSGYGYYTAPTPAPSTCPVCPTCDAAATAESSSRALLSQEKAAGSCYCRYDHDWKTWAVAEPICRTALYNKCSADSRLPCAWLDEYFSAVPSSAGFVRPHEKDIFEFLYNDCPPAAPCSCSGMTFTNKDSPAQAYACCKDLQLYSQIPFSGLSRVAIDAYCGSGKRGAEVSAWVQHTLWHAECPAGVAPRPIYTFKAPAATTTTPKALPAVAKAAASKPAASKPSSKTSSTDTLTKTLLAALGGAVGGALVAVAVVAAIMFLRRPQEEAGYAAL